MGTAHTVQKVLEVGRRALPHRLDKSSLQACRFDTVVNHFPCRRRCFACSQARRGEWNSSFTNKPGHTSTEGVSHSLVKKHPTLLFVGWSPVFLSAHLETFQGVDHSFSVDALLDLFLVDGYQSDSCKCLLISAPAAKLLEGSPGAPTRPLALYRFCCQSSVRDWMCSYAAHVTRR